MHLKALHNVISWPSMRSVASLILLASGALEETLSRYELNQSFIFCRISFTFEITVYYIHTNLESLKNITDHLE